MMVRNFAPGEEKATDTTTTVVKTETGVEEKQHEATIPYERFAEVNQKATEATKQAATLQAQLDKIASDKKAADEAALAEQGKFKELAATKDADIATLKAQFQNAAITNAVILAAGAAGAIDPAAVVALLDKSKVKFEADGSVSGVQEAVDALLKEKKYLIRQTGSGYQMGAGGGGGSGEEKANLTDLLRQAIHG